MIIVKNVLTKECLDFKFSSLFKQLFGFICAERGLYLDKISNMLGSELVIATAIGVTTISHFVIN